MIYQRATVQFQCFPVVINHAINNSIGKQALPRYCRPCAGLGVPLADGAVAPETTAVAKNARLDPEAEELFLAFFALQDTLTKETAAVLAQKVLVFASRA